MRTLFLLLCICLSIQSFAQKDYRRLSLELIHQAFINHVITETSFSVFEDEINKTSDNQLSIFFTEKAKKIFTEIAYGHKPFYLQYVSLKENVNVSSIDSCINLIDDETQLAELIAKFEPKNSEYLSQKNLPILDSLPELKENLNFYRYLNRFNLPKYIVLNIPSATLSYYNNHLKELEMNVVVGRPKNPTPRIATFIDALTIYPYWIPTHSIATKEILPVVKRSRQFLYQNNFSVLDYQGNVVDPESINWAALSASNFPYKFRQSTGCDNSLGLLKFNVVSPFSVYLHDTPHTKFNMSLFTRENRFYSHGCMRLSKPIELANLILEEPYFSEEFMNVCLREQKSKVINLKNKVPIFVIYQTNLIDDKGELKTYKDVYNLNYYE
jgi:L,D-transpeptidase YcbB